MLLKMYSANAKLAEHQHREKTTCFIVEESQIKQFGCTSSVKVATRNGAMSQVLREEYDIVRLALETVYILDWGSCPPHAVMMIMDTDASKSVLEIDQLSNINRFHFALLPVYPSTYLPLFLVKRGDCVLIK